jgi:hypothetical protein
MMQQIGFVVSLQRPKCYVAFAQSAVDRWRLSISMAAVLVCVQT